MTPSQSHTLTPVEPLVATEQGALDGHAVSCSCGFRATTSLGEREALRQGLDHAAYMTQREAATEYGRLARSV